eukprot:6422257-Amphidinium_carterae.1
MSARVVDPFATLKWTLVASSASSLVRCDAGSKQCEAPVSKIGVRGSGLRSDNMAVGSGEYDGIT